MDPAHIRDNTENKVWLNNRDIIEIQVVGPQTADSVVAMGRQIAALVNKLKADGKPVLVIDDITRMGMKQPSEVPKTVAAEAKRINFDRLAMLGSANVMLKYGTNLIIKATRKSESMKYFSTRAEAEQWLLENSKFSRRSGIPPIVVRN